LNFKTESPQKDAEITALRKQVTETQRALDASQEKNTTLQTEVGDLRKKVDDYTKQIQQFKVDKTASAEERRKMEEENKLLQGIVMRVLQEDANRSQRKKMVQKELDRLQVQSDVLLKQINYLTEPVVKLSSAERRLFKRPIIDVQDPNTIVAIKTDTTPDPAPAASSDGQPAAAPAPTPGASAPGSTAPTASAPNAVPEADPVKPAPAAARKSAEMAKLENKGANDLPVKDPAPAAEPGEANKATGNAGGNAVAGMKGLPEEVRPMAEQAKQAFEREKYVEAEKHYDKALQLAPNNLYLWSNKGVTQFRAGKFKNAEESFRKAIAIAPEDHFSWCTLGIVEYSQGKYDDAVNALTKSLAINSKNATAHNYLGITAAQKGWLEAAQKELETAIQLDGKYADAWFNLAVTQTLKTPPNRDEAKKAYQKALELGAEADPAMENLVK
jgi:tetratricopeptide (TPR) repeat protein